MNNIRSFRAASGRERLQGMELHREYLTEEALEQLIAATEAEPMLHPPRGFRDEIFDQIHRKRKRKKNVQLFSYSMKVIAVTAAALGVLLIVPDTIEPKERFYEESVVYQFNNKMNMYCDQFNENLDQLVSREVIYHEKKEK